MKTETLDFDACTQNPLNLFSDTPLLMTSIHRTQESMKSLLMQWVNAHNYQRMWTLLTYSRAIVTYYIEAHRKFIDVFADVAHLSEAHENDIPMPDDVMIDQLMHNNELFNNYLEVKEHIEYLIEQLMTTSTIAISEKQLDAFFTLSDMSREQKMQAVNRMLWFVEKNIQLWTHFREWFAQTSALTKPKLAHALHHDIILPAVYDTIIQSADLDKEIDGEQDDDLVLYKYLLEKKKQLI